jgi:recA bacterial DNA recombination protein
MSASPVFSSAAAGRPFIFSPWLSPRPARSTVGNAVEDLAEVIVDSAVDISVNTAADTKADAQARKTAQILAHVGNSLKLAAVVPASRLEARSAPEMVSSGIPQLDLLTGGFPRGCLTEICGAASSGRTSVLLLALARATQRGEVCALVDASDAFDPASAAAAGMQLNRLLWVRCGEKYPLRNNKNINPNKDRAAARQPVRERKEVSYQGMPSVIPLVAEKTSGFSRWQSQLAQLLKVTDLLLQSNGFGMIALDLGDIPAQSARRISVASWFRFRRAIEHTPTALLVLEQQPIAGSCSSIILKVSGKRLSAVSRQPVENQGAHPKPSHSELFDQLEITAELLCSRLERKSERKFERKPVQSTTSFQSRAAWAG